MNTLSVLSDITACYAILLFVLFIMFIDNLWHTVISYIESKLNNEGYNSIYEFIKNKFNSLK